MVIELAKRIASDSLSMCVSFQCIFMTTDSVVHFTAEFCVKAVSKIGGFEVKFSTFSISTEIDIFVFFLFEQLNRYIT